MSTSPYVLPQPLFLSFVTEVGDTFTIAASAIVTIEEGRNGRARLIYTDGELEETRVSLRIRYDDLLLHMQQDGLLHVYGAAGGDA